MTEYLRLVFGTIVVLAPGAAVARALGQRSAAALRSRGRSASVFVAWTVVFAVHAHDQARARIVLAAIFVAAIVVARGSPCAGCACGDRRGPGWSAIVLGWFLWHVAGPVTGDGLFHEARVRKLVELGDLHLRTVDEFKDGGLHPGYAFPLWHGFVALVSRVSGVDPSEVIRHEAVGARPARLRGRVGGGRRSVRLGGGGRVGAARARSRCSAFAAGHGGSFAQLALPATAARQLYVPAAIALFFSPPGAADAARARASCSGARARAPHLRALPARAAGGLRLAPSEASGASGRRRFAAALVPIGLALLWLRPIVDETRLARPQCDGARAGAPALRRPAGRLERLALSARGGGVRAERRRRRCRARPGAVRRSCLASPLGGVRTRWATARARAARGPVAVRAPVRRGLALAVAACGRVLPVRVRLRRRVRAARPERARAAGGARGRASSCSGCGPATSTTAFTTAARRSPPGSRCSEARRRSRSGCSSAVPGCRSATTSALLRWRASCSRCWCTVPGTGARG